MKKIKILLMFMTISLLLTGCVKFNTNMDIKKDKSMDYTITYAIDTSLFGDTEPIDDEGKKNIEEKGFTISDYNEGNMKGFVLSKKINNIDEVSTTSDVDYDLSSVNNENVDSKYIFKVKKGFFKNVYTAKLKFSSNGNSDVEEVDDNETEIYEEDNFDETNSYEEDDSIEENNTIEEDDYEEEIDLDNSLDSSFENMSSNLDLSYNVKLPYAAISNNATNSSDDKMNLTWTFTTDKVSYVEFTFPIYNMNNIYLTIGIAIVLIAVIIIIIKRKNN